jgi:penicillin G amidase
MKRGHLFPTGLLGSTPLALAAVVLLFTSLSPEVTRAQTAATAPTTETVDLPGLDQPVEILKDRWGIAHIYAETEHDLFFAQGYSAARDRLFQLEVWRRQATGTVAEILGPRELRRDIGTRLFKFRGDLEAELNHYHPRGAEIIRAYVEGINAYVDRALADESLLSMEFEMLGIRPGHWTPEVVISRHQGLLMNVTAELNWGRAVAAIGADAVKDLANFHPKEPDITLDPAIDASLLSDDILGLYNAFRGPVRFRPEDVIAEYRAEEEDVDQLELASIAGPVLWDRAKDDGSNNWIVSGDLTESGYPIMANDPHRVQAAPSLRYWVHLVGPGWNVIGGGEPVLPGVSIGHNEFGAWGLTVFVTDNEDLYVYNTNPLNPNEYGYQGKWESMTVIEESIPVEGQGEESVKLRYTRHGPVVFEDLENNKAYAVRAGWMEIGGAPYLASLRMDQAQTWEEFREASDYSNLPGENMIWAGRDGTIGWQAVGIAPLRRNFSGLVPVPGDGRYEWDGFLPIRDKPHVVNPSEGFFATANESNTPPDYEFWDAIGFEWSDPYRSDRAAEVLGQGRRFNMMDMIRLQTDELSIPARTLSPMLDELRSSDTRAEGLRQRLRDWDYTIAKESIMAAVYVAWERRISRNLFDLLVPQDARPFIRSLSMTRQIEWLTYPDGRFGDDPIAGRDELLVRSLEEAVSGLTERLGGDMSKWQYGQPAYKHVLLRHPLSRAVNETTRDILDVGPVPRGGYQFTVNQTGAGDNQTSGASFRIIVDTSDWDRTVGMNNPGQGGYPGHPHYEDLFELWAQDRFHPVFYTRDKIESVTGERLDLRPGR